MSKKQEFLDKVAANSLCGEDLFLLLDVMEELSKKNEDIIELMEDMKEEDENISINFLVDERKAYLAIKDGVLTTERKILLENPTVTIKMNEETALEILKGHLPLVQAYNDGRIKADGRLMKVASLSILLNIVGDEIGVL